MSLKIEYKIDTIEKPIIGYVQNTDSYDIMHILKKCIKDFKDKNHSYEGEIERIKQEAKNDLIVKIEEYLKATTYYKTPLKGEFVFQDIIQNI